MTLKNDAKFEMKDLMNFHPTTQNLKVPLQWAIFLQSIFVLSKKNTEELPFMAMNSDAKFE